MKKVTKPAVKNKTVTPSVDTTPVQPVNPATRSAVIGDKPAAKKQDDTDFEIELDEEDFKNNPDLALHGLKVGDKVYVPVDPYKGDLTDREVKWVEETLAPYLETYPDEKEFHITSDGQVFLNRNADDAKMHQKQLDPKEEVFICKV